MSNSDHTLANIDAAINGYITRDYAISDDAMRQSPAARGTDTEFGEVIHTYTRADAIEDGNLVAVPADLAREAGIAVPVAMTRAAWEDCVAWTDTDEANKPAALQDETGRLWDMLWMTRTAIDLHRGRSRAAVQLYRVPRGGRTVQARLVTLVAVIGPGDEGEPVLTIQQPGED
jgi:hypothetical protein